MSDLESRVAQLTRAKQRWKALALCMCAGVGLFAVIFIASIFRARAQRAKAEQMHAEALEATAAVELHRDTATQP